MKYTLLIAILLLAFTSSRAQLNMVLNGGLEQYDTCPNDAEQIKYCTHWQSLDSNYTPGGTLPYLNGSPSYCNKCAGGARADFCVPSGSDYFHYPHSGAGMALTTIYYNNWDSAHYTNQRSYLQGHLTAPLTAGKTYCVSFYVVQIFASAYLVNNIGAYLDDGSIDSTHYPGQTQGQYMPQIVDTSIITDTTTWTRIEGTFVATGTEKYITIGGFADTAHTRYVIAPGHVAITTGPGWSSCLVDDISILPVDAAINAGPDKYLASTAADSVKIGDTLDSYLPTYWYINGVKIDSNKAWLMVHPDTTTTYVVELLKCGGNSSYDTVTVHVHTTSVPQVSLSAARLYPNPASDELWIEGAAGSTCVIYDMVGAALLQQPLTTARQAVNIAYLSSGIYSAVITNPQTGERRVWRVVKE